MRIYGITLEQAREAASEVGVRLNEESQEGSRKPYVKTTLRTLTSRYGAVNQETGRRKGAAVCFHGHRDFMRAVFRMNPEAVIKSALATYNGSEHFEEIFPPLGYKNVGSLYAPRCADEECRCVGGEPVVIRLVSIGGEDYAEVPSGRIPLDDALTIWHVYKSPSRRRGLAGNLVDQYTIESATVKGIEIGCTFIPAEELRAFAKEMGWAA